MEYRVRKQFGLFGNYIVLYKCPGRPSQPCGEALVAPLSDAGTEVECPECDKSLIIPGITELANVKRKQAAKKLHKRHGRMTRRNTGNTIRPNTGGAFRRLCEWEFLSFSREDTVKALKILGVLLVLYWLFGPRFLQGLDEQEDRDAQLRQDIRAAYTSRDYGVTYYCSHCKETQWPRNHPRARSSCPFCHTRFK